MRVSGSEGVLVEKREAGRVCKLHTMNNEQRNKKYKGERTSS